MPAWLFNVYQAEMRRLKAQESIDLANTVAAATNNMEKASRRRLVAEWARQARGGSHRARAIGLADLASMGIGVK